MLLRCKKKKSHWDLQTNYHQIQQIELHESLQSSLLKETLGNQTWAAARWERRILTTKPPGNDRLLELCKITNWNGLWTSSRFNNRNSSHITTDLLWLTTTEKKQNYPFNALFVIWISRNSPPFEERPELIFSLKECKASLCIFSWIVHSQQQWWKVGRGPEPIRRRLWDYWSHSHGLGFGVLCWFNWLLL